MGNVVGVAVGLAVGVTVGKAVGVAVVGQEWMHAALSAVPPEALFTPLVQYRTPLPKLTLLHASD